MNIELIKKYKAEFDHWLNGGIILFKFKDNREFYNFNWNESIEEVDYIVINDEYVEFRKALAEGNTIQCNQSGYWEDLNHIPLFNQNISNYRIKPEEPQFKVGDFVRIIPKSKRALTNYGNQNSIGIVKYVTDPLINVKTTNTTSWFELEDCIKYTAQEGELCWFADSLKKNIAVLSTYHKFVDSSSLFKHCAQAGIAYYYCEPFLNSKPSWFKD